MGSSRVIVVAAGWEERSLMGLKHLVASCTPRAIILLFSACYSEATSENRESIARACHDGDIELHTAEVTFDDAPRAWVEVSQSLLDVVRLGEDAVVDLTTMPRETIWMVFELLRARGCPVEYAYHKPQKYSGDWLSRDPGRPSLVPKLGGVVRLGLPTRLLVLTGFDLERVKQLEAFFEPELVLLGLQVGDQYGNDVLNVKAHASEFGPRADVTMFEVDAYSDDCGESAILAAIEPHIDSSNLLMGSLGPKPSAVALYRLHLSRPQTSLVYAPSKEYNLSYSRGIRETILRRLDMP